MSLCPSSPPRSHQAQPMCVWRLLPFQFYAQIKRPSCLVPSLLAHLAAVLSCMTIFGFAAGCVCFLASPLFGPVPLSISLSLCCSTPGSRAFLHHHLWLCHWLCLLLCFFSVWLSAVEYQFVVTVASGSTYVCLALVHFLILCMLMLPRTATR